MTAGPDLRARFPYGDPRIQFPLTIQLPVEPPHDGPAARGEREEPARPLPPPLTLPYGRVVSGLTGAEPVPTAGPGAGNTRQKPCIIGFVAVAGGGVRRSIAVLGIFTQPG